MPALAIHSSALRFLMLAMLMVGVVMSPMLAIACEIRDIQQSVAGDVQPAAAEIPSPNEDCCSVANCNSCCSHSVALQPLFDGAPAVPVTTSALPVLSVDFDPIAVPVALRPPIAA